MVARASACMVPTCGGPILSWHTLAEQQRPADSRPAHLPIGAVRIASAVRCILPVNAMPAQYASPGLIKRLLGRKCTSHLLALTACAHDITAWAAAHCLAGLPSMHDFMHGSPHDPIWYMPLRCSSSPEQVGACTC